MKLLESVICILLLLVVLFFIFCIGFITENWLPLAFICLVIIAFSYRNKITLIAFRDIRVELAQKIERAEDILSAINKISYNLSCTNLQQIASQIYNGAMADEELFECIQRIDVLQKQIAINDTEQQETYRKLRNKAIINCIIFIIEEIRPSILPSPQQTQESMQILLQRSKEIDEFFQETAKCQHRIMNGEIESPNVIMDIINKYRERIPAEELQKMESYVKQMCFSPSVEKE